MRRMSPTSFVPDRKSPVPLYHQVATHLEQAIITGKIPPGTLLDNEIQLAQDLGLSRPTMRRAMQHLVDSGLVVRRRGIGTRVVQPTVRRSLELTSLNEDLEAAGQRPHTEVLGFEETVADEEVAEGLGIETGSPVVHIDRLRWARDLPIARMSNWLPPDVVNFDAADLEEHGLYELMRRAGVVLHSAKQSVGARNARGSEARTLQEPRGSSLLTMTRISYDDHGRAVEYATHLYAASRYAFEISLLSP